MKKTFLWLLAGISLSMAGCDSASPVEEMLPAGLYPLQFNVRLKQEVLPFPSIRSMPPNPIPEPGGGEAEKELDELCSRLEYLVYAGEEPEVAVRHFNLRAGIDPDFGIVYDTLPPGKYQVCFLTHNSEAASLEGQELTFDRVSDSFWGCREIRVDEAGLINEDITLDRVVSRIEFCASDTVPANIERMEIRMEPVIDRLDLATGRGSFSSPQPVVKVYTFLPEDVGKVHFIHAFFTFIPSGDEKLTLRLTACDHRGEVLREQTVYNVVPQANKIIRYTGYLYGKPSRDETFQISVSGNGEWGGREEHELPE